MVAYNMIEWHAVFNLWRYDRVQFGLTLIIAAICIIFDPTMGIVVGAIVGLLRFADHTCLGFSTINESEDRVSMYDLKISEVDTLQCLPRASKTKIGVWYPGNENDVSGMSNHLTRVMGWMQAKLSGSKYISPEDQEYIARVQRKKDLEIARASGVRPKISLESVRGHSVVYRFLGELTFINGFQHYMRLRKFDCVSRIILSFKYCYYIDLDGWENIEFAIKEFTETGGLILITGVNGYNRVFLSKMPWFREKQDKGEVFRSWKDAMKYNEGDPSAEEPEDQESDISAEARMNMALAGSGVSDTDDNNSNLK